MGFLNTKINRSNQIQNTLPDLGRLIDILWPSAVSSAVVGKG